MADEKNKPSTALQQALLAGLPTLVGAIFGGAEGGAIGAQAGLSGLKQLQTAEQAEAQRVFELRKMQAANEASLEMEEKKLKLRAEAPISKAEKERISLAKGRLEQDKAELKALDERHKSNVELRARGANLAEAKAAQLSDKQVDEITDIKVIQKELNKFNLDKLDEGGPVEGRLKGLAADFGIATTAGFDEIKIRAGKQLASYMKSISGAAVSEKEAQRLAALLPNEKDDNELFVSKLQIFKDELNTKLQTKINDIKKGQPLKAETADKLLQDEEPQQIKEMPAFGNFKPGQLIKDKKSGQLIRIK
jgi:hypothetical protein